VAQARQLVTNQCGHVALFGMDLIRAARPMLRDREEEEEEEEREDDEEGK